MVAGCLPHSVATTDVYSQEARRKKRAEVERVLNTHRMRGRERKHKETNKPVFGNAQTPTSPH